MHRRLRRAQQQRRRHWRPDKDLPWGATGMWPDASQRCGGLPACRPKLQRCPTALHTAWSWAKLAPLLAGCLLGAPFQTVHLAGCKRAIGGSRGAELAALKRSAVTAATSSKSTTLLRPCDAAPESYPAARDRPKQLFPAQAPCCWHQGTPRRTKTKRLHHAVAS